MSDSRSRPLVIVWPHEQQQAEVLDRQHAPAPPAGTERPERVYLDPVWTAIGLPKTAKGTAWVSGYGEVITALELQRLVVEANPSPGHPLPDLRHRQWGEIFRPRGKRYDLLRPTVSLNSDGPTIPALRMVDRRIKEFAPSLIVSIGLGGGVNDDDQVGGS